MIQFDAVEAAINARLQAMWTATPLDRIAYENSLLDPTDGAPFVRIYTTQSASPLGENTNRCRGVIYFQACVENGVGKSACTQLIDAARAIFETVGFTNAVAATDDAPAIPATIAVRTERTTQTVSGPDDRWFKSMVAFPFWADEINPA
jgi:hypothetical protein